MKKKLLIFAAVLAPLVAMSSTISISGSATSGSTGVEFADNSGTSLGTEWNDSVKTVDGVTLRVSQTGTDSTLSTANWSTSNLVTPAGSEINFQVGPAWDRSNDFGAVLDDAFISFQLSSDIEITLDSISVSLWRNGAAAAENYQFAYASDGVYLNDTQTNAQSTVADTFLGSPVNNTTSGNTNTFTVTSNLSTDFSTLHEVRLYFWDGTDIAGNTHLYDVTANYTVIPEPSSLLLVALGLSVGVLTLRRRRR